MAQDKFYFERPSSPIKDYPEEKIEELLQGYQSSTPLKEVIKGLSGINTFSFIKYLPYTITDQKCEYCDGFVYTKPRSRTSGIEENRRLCINCKHTFEDNCTCKNCERERKEAFERKKTEYDRQAKEWELMQDTHSYKPSDIGLFEEIQLLVIEASYTMENGVINFKKPKPPNKKVILNRFSTGKPYTDIVLDHREFIDVLIRKKILLPIGGLEYQEEFTPDENGKYRFTLDLMESYWKINIDFSDGRQAYLDFLRERTYSDEEKWFLWKNIYRNELKQYLNYQNSTYLDSTLDISLLDIYMDELMEKFSLARAYSIIYYTFNDVKYYIRKHRPTKRALQTRFLNLLEEKINSGKENIHIKDFNRLKFELSDVHNYILENILEIKDHFFHLHITDFSNPLIL